MHASTGPFRCDDDFALRSRLSTVVRPPAISAQHPGAFGVQRCEHACEQSEMEDGTVLDFVMMSFDDYPDLFSVQIAFEELVIWTMHIPQRAIDVDMALALVDAVEDTYWTGDTGDQGELKLIRYLYAESDEEMEEELLAGISEFIDLNDLCGTASSQAEEAQFKSKGRSGMSRLCAAA